MTINIIFNKYLSFLNILKIELYLKSCLCLTYCFNLRSIKINLHLEQELFQFFLSSASEIYFCLYFLKNKSMVKNQSDKAIPPGYYFVYSIFSRNLLLAIFHIMLFYSNGTIWFLYPMENTVFKMKENFQLEFIVRSYVYIVKTFRSNPIVRILNGNRFFSISNLLSLTLLV